MNKVLKVSSKYGRFLAIHLHSVDKRSSLFVKVKIVKTQESALY
jgi:hypothetical protein